jgi:hypothetical protein
MLHPMNVSAFDLNHVRALYFLLEEAHVARAARRLGITPAAASNALRRLRSDFDDELLVRTGRTLVRTPLAEQLRGPAREVLGRSMSRPSCVTTVALPSRPAPFENGASRPRSCSWRTSFVCSARGIRFCRGRGRCGDSRPPSTSSSCPSPRPEMPCARQGFGLPRFRFVHPREAGPARPWLVGRFIPRFTLKDRVRCTMDAMAPPPSQRSPE